MTNQTDNGETPFYDLRGYKGADIFNDALDERKVVEPYYTKLVEDVGKIEKELVLLTQSALVYLQCCTDKSEAYYMTKVLRNLLEEHKLQMKIVDCAHTTFDLK